MVTLAIFCLLVIRKGTPILLNELLQLRFQGVQHTVCSANSSLHDARGLLVGLGGGKMESARPLCASQLSHGLGMGMDCPGRGIWTRTHLASQGTQRACARILCITHRH